MPISGDFVPISGDLQALFTTFAHRWGLDRATMHTHAPIGGVFTRHTQCPSAGTWQLHNTGALHEGPHNCAHVTLHEGSALHTQTNLHEGLTTTFTTHALHEGLNNTTATHAAHHNNRTCMHT